jgi:hypothetical protein
MCCVTTAFVASNSRKDNANPINGLNASALKTPSAWFQSTPEAATPSVAISWLAMPTPTMEPINACEELFGRPSAQAPNDRRDQQRENHGIPGAAADLKDQLHRQQRNDGEGDGALAQVGGDAVRHDPKARGEHQQERDGAEMVRSFVQVWTRRLTFGQVQVDRCV